jgi:hypothetical protein
VLASGPRAARCWPPGPERRVKRTVQSARSCPSGNAAG